MSLHTPNLDESEESWIFPMRKKASHARRRTPLTRAAIEATLLVQSAQHELEPATSTRFALSSPNWTGSRGFAPTAQGTL